MVTSVSFLTLQADLNSTPSGVSAPSKKVPHPGNSQQKSSLYGKGDFFFGLPWPIAMDDHDDDDLPPRRRRLGRGKAEAEAR